VEYCIKELLKQKKTPEVEVFEIGHIHTMQEFMTQYDFVDPVLFSIVLGHQGEAPATPQALAAMIQMIPSGTLWGITQANRKEFGLIAAALGLGASTVRIGFEDSRYLDAHTIVGSNVPLVEKTVRLLQAMDKEPMNPEEARQYFNIGGQ
jgi:3-keto-5-aminohexanoate cleavage enzyme